MMRNYELTIIPKNSIESRELISSLQIQPTKEQKSSKFLSFEFFAESENIEEIEKKLKAESQIARYMIVKKEILSAPAPAPETDPEKRPEKEKVELGEIDKKLKEIFGEN